MYPLLSGRQLRFGEKAKVCFCPWSSGFWVCKSSDVGSTTQDKVWAPRTLNTCAFIEPHCHKNISALFTLLLQRQINPLWYKHNMRLNTWLTMNIQAWPFIWHIVRTSVFYRFLWIGWIGMFCVLKVPRMLAEGKCLCFVCRNVSKC